MTSPIGTPDLLCPPTLPLEAEPIRTYNPLLKKNVDSSSSYLPEGPFLPIDGEKELTNVFPQKAQEPSIFSDFLSLAKKNIPTFTGKIELTNFNERLSENHIDLTSHKPLEGERPPLFEPKDKAYVAKDRELPYFKKIEDKKNLLDRKDVELSGFDDAGKSVDYCANFLSSITVTYSALNTDAQPIILPDLDDLEFDSAIKLPLVSDKDPVVAGIPRRDIQEYRATDPGLRDAPSRLQPLYRTEVKLQETLPSIPDNIEEIPINPKNVAKHGPQTIMPDVQALFNTAKAQTIAQAVIDDSPGLERHDANNFNASSGYRRYSRNAMLLNPGSMTQYPQVQLQSDTTTFLSRTDANLLSPVSRPEVSIPVNHSSTFDTLTKSQEVMLSIPDNIEKTPINTSKLQQQTIEVETHKPIFNTNETPTITSTDVNRSSLKQQDDDKNLQSAVTQILTRDNRQISVKPVETIINTDNLSSDPISNLSSNQPKEFLINSRPQVSISMEQPLEIDSEVKLQEAIHPRLNNLEKLPINTVNIETRKLQPMLSDDHTPAFEIDKIQTIVLADEDNPVLERHDTYNLQPPVRQTSTENNKPITIKPTETMINKEQFKPSEAPILSSKQQYQKIIPEPLIRPARTFSLITERMEDDDENYLQTRVAHTIKDSMVKEPGITTDSFTSQPDESLIQRNVVIKKDISMPVNEPFLNEDSKGLLSAKPMNLADFPKTKSNSARDPKPIVTPEESSRVSIIKEIMTYFKRETPLIHSTDTVSSSLSQRENEGAYPEVSEPEDGLQYQLRNQAPHLRPSNTVSPSLEKSEHPENYLEEISLNASKKDLLTAIKSFEPTQRELGLIIDKPTFIEREITERKRAPDAIIPSEQPIFHEEERLVLSTKGVEIERVINQSDLLTSKKDVIFKINELSPVKEHLPPVNHPLDRLVNNVADFFNLRLAMIDPSSSENSKNTLAMNNVMNSQLEHTPAPTAFQFMTGNMTTSLKINGYTAKIKVSPPELGQITAEIMLNKSGTLLMLQAENPEVRHFIETNLHQLRESFQNVNINLSQITLQQNSMENRNNFHEEQQRTPFDLPEYLPETIKENKQSHSQMTSNSIIDTYA